MVYAPSQLRALADLIVKSVDAIEASCSARDVSFPSLDESFSPESEAVRMHPDVLPNIAVAAAAAYQLYCTIRAPATNLLGTATQVWMRCVFLSDAF